MAGPQEIQPIDMNALEAPELPDLSAYLQESALANSVLPSIMQPAPYMGEIVLDDEEEKPDTSDLKHRDNLALVMTESALNKLATELAQGVEADYQSGARWREEFKKGMILMGIVDASHKGPFTHASMATHPMIAEACIRFWARSMPELLPPKGPAEGKINGRTTEEKEQQAIRAADYINYQITKEDRGYRDATDKLIFQLPLRGCGFRKMRYDEEMDTVVGEYVEPDQMIGQYGITSFRTAGRFTHRYPMAPHVLKRKQLLGIYRDVDIQTPTLDDSLLETQELKDQASGVDQNEDSNVDHIIDEIYVMLDLEGFEETDDFGEETGMALPYIVTMETGSQKILAIYRDWRERDTMKERIRRWVKYQYLPGFGFYSLGLVALIGSLADQSSALMRIITNGGAFASIPGGFRSKNSRIKDDDLVLEPGVFKAVDGSPDEIANAFYTPQLKGPEPVLLEMLAHGEGLAQRLTSTTDIEVGDGDANAPVGTTMALLEKAQEISNAIQVNLHASLEEELEIRYEFTREFIAPRGRAFTWNEGEEEQAIDALTFDPNNTKVSPTTDPSQSSFTKRIASAQLGYQMAAENPDVMDKEAAIRRVLVASEVPDPESLFKKSTPPQPMDPISENAAALNGRPIKAAEDQDHMSHIAVHKAFLENPEYGGNPDIAEVLGPAMMSHIAEHLAFLYTQQARNLGVEVVPPQEGENGMESPLPPEIQTLVAQQAASVVDQLRQIPGLAGGIENAEADEKLRSTRELNDEKLRFVREKNEMDLDHQAASNEQDHTAGRMKLINDMSDASTRRDAKLADQTIDRENKIIQIQQQQQAKKQGGLPK